MLPCLWELPDTAVVLHKSITSYDKVKITHFVIRLVYLFLVWPLGFSIFAHTHLSALEYVKGFSSTDYSVSLMTQKRAPILTERFHNNFQNKITRSFIWVQVHWKGKTISKRANPTQIVHLEHLLRYIMLHLLPWLDSLLLSKQTCLMYGRVKNTATLWCNHGLWYTDASTCPE